MPWLTHSERRRVPPMALATESPISVTCCRLAPLAADVAAEPDGEHSKARCERGMGGIILRLAMIAARETMQRAHVSSRATLASVWVGNVVCGSCQARGASRSKPRRATGGSTQVRNPAGRRGGRKRPGAGWEFEGASRGPFVFVQVMLTESARPQADAPSSSGGTARAAKRPSASTTRAASSAPPSAACRRSAAR